MSSAFIQGKIYYKYLGSINEQWLLGSENLFCVSTFYPTRIALPPPPKFSPTPWRIPGYTIAHS